MELDPTAYPAHATALTDLPVATASTLAVGSLPPPATSTDYRELIGVAPEHYIVGQQIARGGMGRILKAHDRRLGREVAIKELLVKSDELRARFEREARITAKLQHPSIVNILEAGTWPSGEPFYAMKLVAGRPLDEAIAACSTQAERLALLPNLIAVADALAYAHSRQVIHRDLKPGNVLVGEFGETVVIDWGLAKELGERTANTPSASPSSRSQVGQTEYGAVMGTPQYMPSEQALGAEVDQRADVYALGAMLYHLLSGRIPYSGSNGLAVLAAVLEGPPAPLAEVAPDAPPDLIAIVDKAMARAAVDRYADARGLADDLKRFQTGQLVGAHSYTTWQLVRRWTKRHRTPLAVAAVAAVVVLVGGVASVMRIVDQQHNTEHLRELAVGSRNQADDFAFFMLGDFRKKLSPIGRLDLLDDIARKAQPYFEQARPDESVAELAYRAIALRELGEVLDQQSHVDAARNALRLAVLTDTALYVTNPASSALRAELAASQDALATALMSNTSGLGGATGNPAEALAHRELALELREATAASRHDDMDATRALAATHLGMTAPLMATGKNDDALVHAHKALELEDAAEHVVPGVAVNVELAEIHDRLGDLAAARGDSSTAKTEYVHATQMLGTAKLEKPDDMAIVSKLSAFHYNYATYLISRAELEPALSELRLALESAGPSAAADPTNANKRAQVALVHQMMGDVFRRESRLADARTEYTDGLSVFEELERAHPDDDKLTSYLSTAHERFSMLLKLDDDKAGALDHARTSLRLRSTLAQRWPNNADVIRDEGISHFQIGQLLQAYGHRDEALAEFDKARERYQRAYDTNHNNVNAEISMHNAVLLIGDMQDQAGDQSSAFASYQHAVELADRSLARDKKNAVYAATLALDLARLATMEVATGEAPAAVDGTTLPFGSTDGRGQTPAVEHAKRAVELSTTAAAQRPDYKLLVASVPFCQSALGMALTAAGDPGAAIESLRRAIDFDQKQSDAARDDVTLRGYVARDRERMADAALAHGDFAAGVAELHKALALHLKAIKDTPSHAEHPRHVAIIHRKLGDALAGHGQTAAARAEYRAGLAAAQAAAALDPTNQEVQRALQELTPLAR